MLCQEGSRSGGSTGPPTFEPPSPTRHPLTRRIGKKGQIKIFDKERKYFERGSPARFRVPLRCLFREKSFHRRKALPQPPPPPFPVYFVRGSAGWISKNILMRQYVRGRHRILNLFCRERGGGFCFNSDLLLMPPGRVHLRLLVPFVLDRKCTV
ncbi:hypothetical protein GWI33_003199 [Rhynchophorus ferrugineus]|uniref:Uncharacterized protein n=1 Tax=Rhynchophorus ferrugineus TaxID=354439 RepID=A0A834MK46_RHYFE|nr:hypothetical protein GWI33_003199 [Rhynchophorus ferrugineus]